jgi:hypothetical protein
MTCPTTNTCREAVHALLNTLSDLDDALLRADDSERARRVISVLSLDLVQVASRLRSHNRRLLAAAPAPLTPTQPPRVSKP